MGTTLKPLSPEALRAELTHAWRTIFLVLIALWIAKSVGGGILGTALATVAMGLQLYLPIRWLHRTLQPDSVIGWHRRGALSRPQTGRRNFIGDIPTLCSGACLGDGKRSRSRD